MVGKAPCFVCFFQCSFPPSRNFYCALKTSRYRKKEGAHQIRELQGVSTAPGVAHDEPKKQRWNPTARAPAGEGGGSAEEEHFVGPSVQTLRGGRGTRRSLGFWRARGAAGSSHRLEVGGLKQPKTPETRKLITLLSSGLVLSVVRVEKENGGGQSSGSRLGSGRTVWLASW